jgi:hypothetical protein
MKGFQTTVLPGIMTSDCLFHVYVYVEAAATGAAFHLCVLS